MKHHAESLNGSNRLRTGITAAWAALFPFVSHSGSALAQRFNVVEYEYPQEYYIIEVNAINNRAEMVGTGYRETGGTTALLWQADGRVVELPHLLPHTAMRYWRDRRSAQAHDINDHGFIAGRSEGSYLGAHAVLWVDQWTVIDLLGRDGVAYNLNNDPSVVGYGDGTFLWRDGVAQTLSLMVGIDGINNLGQVVGQGSGGKALLYDRDANKYSVLEHLGVGARAKPSDINDLGVISGWSTTSAETGFYYPVWWKNGRVRELARINPDTMASVYAINNRGEMMGSSFDPVLDTVFYRNNLTMVLDDLLLESIRDEWGTVAPMRLNDAGQIGGRGYHQPSRRAFPVRLDPVDTGLTLWSIEPSRPGVRNEIQINHATPGGRVSLLWGTTRGEPQPLEQCPGAMIDIIDPRLAATTVAGPDGRAVIRLNVPAHIDGTYMFQVVDHGSCEVSPPAWAIIQPEN